MFVRVVSMTVAAILAASGSVHAQSVAAAGSPAPETLEVSAEEWSLAALHGRASAFVLTNSQTMTRINFDLPPGARASEATLRLAARPQAPTTSGLIHVSVNGGDPITIRPQAREMEARFALFSADVRPGANVLEIRFDNQRATPGWIIDAQRSQLRLTLDAATPVSTLAELEQVLAADFAAPRRIALVTEDTQDRVMLEALVAQGIALRTGNVPLFTADAENADLVIRVAPNHALAAADRAALRNSDQSAGPEIGLLQGATPRLILTGRNAEEAAAAARLMAARSFAGQGVHFGPSQAIAAPRLGEAPVRLDTPSASVADLATFAATGRPFSDQHGSRTAVQFAVSSDADRAGALSVMARAALISGEAWLYAWYGDLSQTAPASHNLLVIGPDSFEQGDVAASAPAELRAALRAAERSRGQRGVMSLAAAAYADDIAASTQPADSGITGIGVASVFADVHRPGRTIATLTSPEMASFEAASRSLARSELWRALEGRAAVWSSRGVTSLDYSVSAPSLLDRGREMAIDHTRDAAFILFGAALLLLARGLSRRRRRTAQA
ncbi:hypothetical protein [Maricaulis sp. CAU 1757]